MNHSALAQLSEHALSGLRNSLQSGVLIAPFSSLTLSQYLPNDQVAAVRGEFSRYAAVGATPPMLVMVIDSLLQQRAELSDQTSEIELVMTGPEPPGAYTRDTAVVVRQMFANAKQSICIAGFAVYQGQTVFEALATRMESLPELNVRMYLNVDRPFRDDRPTHQILRRFSERFRETQWPEGVRLPEVFFDPRPLDDTEQLKSACLHAKFVVADHERVFISSANFTEAAHQRNIEAGIATRDHCLATQLENYFEALVDNNDLLRLSW